MEITRATEQDLNDIYLLNATLLNEGERWSQDMLSQDFKLSTYLVAKIESTIVGFISYRVVLDECEIFQVCVDKSFQRRKVATSLLNKLIQIEKVKTIFLEVNVKNLNAIAFYKKHNFVILGERKNYYGSECAYNMMLNL